VALACVTWQHRMHASSSSSSTASITHKIQLGQPGSDGTRTWSPWMEMGMSTTGQLSRLFFLHTDASPKPRSEMVQPWLSGGTYGWVKLLWLTGSPASSLLRHSNQPNTSASEVLDRGLSTILCSSPEASQHRIN
jgi:hypothetical protein